MATFGKRSDKWHARVYRKGPISKSFSLLKDTQT
jgi:hypothetical protein